MLCDKDRKYLAELDGVAAVVGVAAAAAAFARFLDTFGFVGGGAAGSAAGMSFVCSLATTQSHEQHS